MKLMQLEIDIKQEIKEWQSWLRFLLLSPLSVVLLSLKLAYGQEVGTSMNFTKLFQQKYQDNGSNALLNGEFHT